ncbi:MAG: hypothetical protein IKN17_02375 [Ruminococcus sp.]|nr:hypothetical protein [Ruminococcus sp.]
MKMKKFSAVFLSLALCISMTACGSTDSSDDDGDTGAATPWGAAAESKADKSEADEDSEAESKADVSKAEEPKTDVSKADEPASQPEPEISEPEPSEPEPEVSEPEPEVSEPEPESTPDEPAPSGNGTIVKGLNYTFEISGKWVDASNMADNISGQTSKEVQEKLGMDTSSYSGMEIICYYDDGDESDNYPMFNSMKPVQNSAFKLIDIEQYADVLFKSIESQAGTASGITVKKKGISTYGGVKFLELETSYDLGGDLAARARQFFGFVGEYEYVFSFSIPSAQFDEMQEETEKIMKTLKFTEV